MRRIDHRRERLGSNAEPPDADTNLDTVAATAAEAKLRRREAERALEATDAEEGLYKPYEVAKSSGAFPRHQFTPLLDHIERMAYQGLSQAQIALRLGVDPAMFRWAAGRYEDMKLAISGGLARGADELSATVMRAAVRGNPNAAMAMLKAKHEYAEPASVATQVAVQVNVGTGAAPVGSDHADSLAERQAALLRGGPGRLAVAAPPNPPDPPTIDGAAEPEPVPGSG